MVWNGRFRAAWTQSCKALCIGALLFPPLVWGDSVTIGAEDDAAPWSYRDGIGYVNDLVRAAYVAVGWKVNYQVLPYARCKLLAEKGTLAACFSASKTPELEKLLQYPKFPVFDAHNVLFAKADSSLQGCSVGEWKRKIFVGFVNEYEYLPQVEALQKSNAIHNVTANSETLLLRMLVRGRFDAAIINVDAVKRIEFVAKLAHVRPDFKVVCDFGGAPAYVAFSRVHPQADAALQALDKGMEILIKNGTQARLQKEWEQRALAFLAHTSSDE